MTKILVLLALAVSCASHKENLSPEEVLSRRIVKCYDDSASFSKFKKGKIKFRIGHAKDGTVKSIRPIESDFKDDPNLEACAGSALKERNLPPLNPPREFEMIQEVNYTMERRIQ